MPVPRRPVITDERKITVDGKDYTLAELQALYDAIAAVPGIKVKVVEKIVEKQPYTYPLGPIADRPRFIESPNTPTINPFPRPTEIWCTGWPSPNQMTGKDNGERAYNTRIEMLATATN